MYYFETNHGQNEGDSMHSVIECAMRKAGTIMLPSHLSMVIRLARKVPYIVHEITTSSVLDWKEYS